MCRLRHVSLALQWHPRRELAARQNHTRSRFAALARVRSTHMGVNAALAHTRSRCAALARVGLTHMGVNAAFAERGTCARPTQARALALPIEVNEPQVERLYYTRNPTLSRKAVPNGHKGDSRPLGRGEPNRRAVGLAAKLGSPRAAWGAVPPCLGARACVWRMLV